MSFPAIASSSKISCIVFVRWNSRSTHAVRTEPPPWIALTLEPTDMAAPSSTSIIIPAFNEADAIGDVVSHLKAVATWREILVIDDGSSDDTAARARDAGAIVVTHPYNKGNGASVKTGIRRASGEFVLIVDGDGQHRAEDALRVVAGLGTYDLVVGARSSDTQATVARRVGNWALNSLAGYLTDRQIPDLTSGLRAARGAYMREFLHLLPNGFSTPTTTTLAFIKTGHNVGVRARQRVGADGPLEDQVHA